MGEEISRDAVLAGIRRANKGSGLNSAVTDPSYDSAIGKLSPDPLVDRFVARAQAAQASVTVVSSFTEARQRVAAILAQLGCSAAAVSDDAWHAPWDAAQLPLERHARNGLAETAVGITAAAYGIADTGTVVVCSGAAGGRVESLLPPVHIALLAATDLVPDLPELLTALGRDRRLEQSSAVTLITGPSRTADIELTLTIGVHGPRQLFIVVVNDDHLA